MSADRGVPAAQERGPVPAPLRALADALAVLERAGAVAAAPLFALSALALQAGAPGLTSNELLCAIELHARCCAEAARLQQRLAAAQEKHARAQRGRAAYGLPGAR
jgi:hypothetical protein